jgi:hypothetical protein
MKAEQQSVNRFCGTWNVRRRIFDVNTQSCARFEGRASITPVQFDEHGDMLANGAELRSSRIYRLDCEGRGVTVRFAGSREFIRVEEAASQRLTHQCGDDLYRGRLAFLSANRWVEIWRVFGPRKNYRSIAFYRRV